MRRHQAFALAPVRRSYHVLPPLCAPCRMVNEVAEPAAVMLDEAADSFLLDEAPSFVMQDDDEAVASAMLAQAAYSAMLAESAASAMLVEPAASDVRALQAWRSASPAGHSIAHFSTKLHTLHKLCGLHRVASPVSPSAKECVMLS